MSTEKTKECLGLKSCNWIKPADNTGDVCPIFRKKFSIRKDVTAAQLSISAMGVYEAVLNSSAVGDFFMAPGWTAYNKRHLYQEYDITDMLEKTNVIEVTVGRGWYSGRIAWPEDDRNGIKNKIWGSDFGLIALITVTYTDGTIERIQTDETWEYAKSPILFSEIYDGETYEARVTPSDRGPVQFAGAATDTLLPHDGEFVTDQEQIAPLRVFTTPKAETIIDFGQDIAGRLELKIDGKEGDVIEISHAEVLDKDGNFYTENLRSAKQKIKYICKDGLQTYKPHFSFMGFRYIRLDKYPYEVRPENFTAIVAHSDMKRTGYFKCSNPKLNKLYENIIWGQKGNFVDVPTDCPQRDERLGWTGDAQVFVRTASYNYDVRKFFKKWLRDLAAEQFPGGEVPNVIPNALGTMDTSAAWGDAAVICPWQIYLTYGDKEILKDQYSSMRKWVEYIRKTGDNEFLWNTGEHFGDWLGLDAPAGSYKGSTDMYYIATAFYAYSTSLLVKTAKVLGYDCTEYEELYRNIVAEFQKTFVCKTQTEHVLALYFNLTADKQKTAAALAKMVVENGNKLTTGFVGTPYLLHALSENGYAEIAYNLLLQEGFPSWLYSVNQGATTIWEHWDGINDKGEMWSRDMNSFNHYAYGAVADWMYGVAAGIRIDESKPAFEHVILEPITDKRLGFVEASIDTKFGKVSSKWTFVEDAIKYEFEVPNTATIILDGNSWEVTKGKYIKWCRVAD